MIFVAALPFTAFFFYALRCSDTLLQKISLCTRAGKRVFYYLAKKPIIGREYSHAVRTEASFPSLHGTEYVLRILHSIDLFNWSLKIIRHRSILKQQRNHAAVSLAGLLQGTSMTAKRIDSVQGPVLCLQGLLLLCLPGSLCRRCSAYP